MYSGSITMGCKSVKHTKLQERLTASLPKLMRANLIMLENSCTADENKQPILGFWVGNFDWNFLFIPKF